MKKRETIFILLIPALLIYLVLFLYPIFGSIRYSLYDWSGFGSNMNFMGLNNYRELFGDRTFRLCFKNTLIYMFFGGFFIFFLSFLFTFLLTNIKTFPKKVFRAIIILPYMLSPVAIANIWSYIYNPRFGFANSFLRFLRLDFLTQLWTAPNNIVWSLSIALVWFQVGFYTIVMLAASEKIPPDYYEVADLDGAGKFQKFFHITIPLILNELEVCAIFWSITAIKMFGLIFAFDLSGEPSIKTWTGAVYMYILAFGKMTSIFRFGYASTVAVSLIIITIIFVGLIRIILGRRERFEY